MEKFETAQPTIESLQERNEILEEANEDLVRQVEELSKNAFYDQLTGLATRNFLKEEIKRSYYFEAENRDKMSLIMFDIDYFKKVNDTFGHDAGDEVLRDVAATILRYVRRGDMAVRWGGEEILVVLDGADLERAAVKADFIREKVSQIEFPNHPDLKVTISGGVAESTHYDNLDALIKAADSALYQSKHSGRNRITRDLSIDIPRDLQSGT